MSEPKIGLALGGGGARGIAHIPMLEVFDELGIAPAVIAGTSMGALIGAGYASGLSAKAIREHTVSVLANKVDAARHLFINKRGSLRDLIDFKLFGHVMIDGTALAELVLPPGVAERIEDTKIPFKCIATDFYQRREVVIESGPLCEAVAASIAIPGVIAGPRRNGEILADGGMTNQVPFDHVAIGTDITVAIDVTGKPVPTGREVPKNMDLALGSLQVMQYTVTAMKMAANPPDIYVAPDVDRVRVLDFFRVEDILKAGEKSKDDLKRALSERLALFAN